MACEVTRAEFTDASLSCYSRYYQTASALAMAVSRRQKENDTFSDIAHTLPIEESAKELDKASVLRIAIHYLKLRDVLADCEDCNGMSDYMIALSCIEWW